MAMVTPAVSVAEARNDFSKIGAAIVESGCSVTVFRYSKPWIVISPASAEGASYEQEANGVLERGEHELAEGRCISLGEFRDKHRGEIDG